MCGCSAKNNLKSIFSYKAEPRIEIFKNPEFNSLKWKTFSIIKTSEYFEKYYIKNEIVEMQLLFFLRNALEARGYTFVQLDENPDIIATIDSLNLLTETFIPPQQFSSPKWVPEKSITTHESARGDIRYRGNKIGTYSGSGVSTTYIPGYMSSEIISTPAQFLTSYDPAIGIYFFTPKKYEKLWTGVAVTSTDNPDIRVTSQLLILKILSNIAEGPSIKKYNDIKHAFYTNFGIFTLNGSDYYPILQPHPNNSKIFENDILISINNRSVKNISFSELLTILSDEYLTQNLQFEVFRNNKLLHVALDSNPSFTEKIKYHSLSEKASLIRQKVLKNPDNKSELLTDFDKVITEMIVINPQGSELYALRASSRSMNMQGELAMEDINKAISLDKNEAGFYECKAYIYILNYKDFFNACIYANEACKRGICNLKNDLSKQKMCTE